MQGSCFRIHRNYREMPGNDKSRVKPETEICVCELFFVILRMFCGTSLKVDGKMQPLAI